MTEYNTLISPPRHFIEGLNVLKHFTVQAQIIYPHTRVSLDFG